MTNMNDNTAAAVTKIVRRYHEMWDELNKLTETSAPSSQWDELRGDFEVEAFNLLSELSSAVGDDAYLS